MLADRPIIAISTRDPGVGPIGRRRPVAADLLPLSAPRANPCRPGRIKLHAEVMRDRRDNLVLLALGLSGPWAHS
jgi:hypothetical protein